MVVAEAVGVTKARELAEDARLVVDAVVDADGETRVKEPAVLIQVTPSG